jgi:hypothetical protein
LGQLETETLNLKPKGVESYMRIRLCLRTARVTLLTVTALVLAGHWVGSTLAQTRLPESEIRPFVGTWTAVHAGTPIIVLHLHSEKGELLGEVQVCSYSVNTETTGTVDVVSDPTLSKSTQVKNIKVSGKALSFDWTDPDGDNDHWRLELTGKNTGQIVWLDLPSDVKVQPIPVSKTIAKSG